MLSKLLPTKAEKAYEWERYRFPIYGFIFLLILMHVAVSIYYQDFFKELIDYHIGVAVLGVMSLFSLWWFSRKADSVLFFATMSMEEWKHKTYEIFLIKKLFKEIADFPYFPMISAVVSGVTYYILAKYGLITNITDDDFKLIWQIHATILGLIFITLSFLIGQLNTDEFKKIDVGKRLANRLHFGELVVLNTFLTLLVGASALFSDVSLQFEAVSVGAFIFLIASIIYLFRNFMKYLFQLDLLRELVLWELKQNLRNSLTEEIRLKVSQNLFIDYAKRLNICADRKTSDNHSVAICSDIEGVVSDVSLKNLKKMSKKITGKIPVIDYEKNKTEQFKAVLTKGVGSFYGSITKRHNEIALVPRDEEKMVRKLAQSVFKVQDFGVKNEFSENLKQLVDTTISYLKVSPNRSLEVLKFMGNMIDESLEVMSEYKIEFNYETSKDLTLFDWRNISQIIYSLDDVYKEIYNSGNPMALDGILPFIENRINASMEHKNHYLFKEFFNNYVRQYYLAQQASLSNEKKQEVTEKVARKIENIFKFEIKLDQDFSGNNKEVDFHIGIVTDVQKGVWEMVRGALEMGDVHGVKTFTETLLKVSSTLGRYRNDILYIENMADMVRLDIGESGETKDRLAKLKYFKKIISLNKKLEIKRELSMFALGAWVVELYDRGELDESKLIEALDSFTKHFTDRESLVKTYFEAISDRDDGLNLWGWGTKEGVHTVNLNWLKRFYVLLILDKLYQDPQPEFIYAEGISKYSPSYLRGEKDGVVEMLDDIEKRCEFWKPLLEKTRTGDNGVREKYSILEKKDDLILLHEKGIEKREQEEEDFIIQSDIDPDILQKFKDQFFDRYKKTDSIKKIIQKFGKYKDLTREPDKSDRIPSMGISSLYSKDIYIKDWYTSYPGNVGNCVSAMIENELEHVIRTLDKKIQFVGNFKSDGKFGPEEEMVNKIDCMIKKITQAGHQPNVIFVGGGAGSGMHYLESKKDFVSSQYSNDNSYYGHYGKYKNIDMFKLPGVENIGKIFVLDLQKIGELKQLQLKDKEGVEISLEVKQIKPETIDEWVKEDADIIKKDGVQMTRDEIDKYMGKRVDLEILQKINFEVTDNTAGLYAKKEE